MTVSRLSDFVVVPNDIMKQGKKNANNNYNLCPTSGHKRNMLPPIRLGNCGGKIMTTDDDEKNKSSLKKGERQRKCPEGWCHPLTAATAPRIATLVQSRRVVYGVHDYNATV